MFLGEYETVQDEESDAVAFSYEYDSPKGSGRLRYGYACFVGRQSKPMHHFWYNTEDERNAGIERSFDYRRKHCAAKKQRKEEAERAGRGLEVGDILSSSWGYEQTNVDFYQVTKLIGKKTVELCRIASREKSTGTLSGECWPEPDVFVDVPFKKRAANGRVQICSYASACKITPVGRKNGVNQYAPRYWTAYH